MPLTALAGRPTADGGTDVQGLCCLGLGLDRAGWGCHVPVVWGLQVALARGAQGLVALQQLRLRRERVIRD